MTEEENTFFLLICRDTCGYFVQTRLTLSSKKRWLRSDGKFCFSLKKKKQLRSLKKKITEKDKVHYTLFDTGQTRITYIQEEGIT